MKKHIILLVCYCLFITVSNAQNTSLKKLSLESYLDLEVVSDARISPNGGEILYTRQWIDKINDKRISDTWIVNANGGKNRFLMKGSSAKWSPDGTRITFLNEGEPKGSQIFVKYKDTDGAPTQITRVDRTPTNLTWSPDGKFIAFTMRVPEKSNWNVKLPKPEGAKWTEEPRFIDELVYRRDRVGFIEEGKVHIFIVPAEGGTPRQLTKDEWDNGEDGICFTKDGSEILFSGLRTPEADYAYRESEIYAVNVKTNTVRQLTNRKGEDYNPQISPDGKMVAYVGYDWTDDTYIDSKLYVMNLDGSNAKVLSNDLDRSPNNLFWASDNSGVYMTVSDKGTSNLYFTSMKGGTKQVTVGNQMLNITDINAQGIAVGTLTNYLNPADLVTFNVLKPTPQKLTEVNEDILSGVTLGQVEEVWYKSLDNFDIQGWVIKPPDFDPAKKYPLILVIHGGPHGMYSVAFNYTWQLHAAEGYVVLYTNPRGSSGYGSPFGNAIKNDYPNKDYTDLMNGVDEVIKKGYVDDKRLFVYGGSGGGVLTSWIVGHTDRFAAASVNFPVINWLSFVGTTDGVGWYKNFKKLPWEDPSEHLRRSPLMYVGNVNTPTMLMTGVNDLRTPISQTEEFYQALKIQKVPTVMIRFNEEFHGTSAKPSNFLRTAQYLHYWFKKYDKKTN